MVRTLNKIQTINYLTEENWRILDKSNYKYIETTVKRRKKIVDETSFSKAIINYFNKFEDETEPVKIKELANPSSIERYRALSAKEFKELEKAFLTAHKEYIQSYKEKNYTKYKAACQKLNDPLVQKYIKYTDLDSNKLISKTEISLIKAKVNKKEYLLNASVPGHVNIFGELKEGDFKALDVSKTRLKKNVSGKDKKISDAELLAYLKYADKDDDGVVTHKEQHAANKKIKQNTLRAKREIRTIFEEEI